MQGETENPKEGDRKMSTNSKPGIAARIGRLARKAAKWAFVGLAVATFFTSPMLAAVAATIMLLAWACGALVAPADEPTKAQVATRAGNGRSAEPEVAEAALPTTNDVMRSWICLF